MPDSAKISARIAQLDELVPIIREELKVATDGSDHVEEFDLRRELNRAADERRRLSVELHLINHPKKRAGATVKKVRCPDCGHWAPEDVVMTTST
jgi:hypothetical protein